MAKARTAGKRQTTARRQAASRRLRRLAYHEAAHAVMAYIVGRGITEVTIEPDEHTLGHVSTTKWPARVQPDVHIDGRSRNLLEADIMVSLAGWEAERRLRGRAPREFSGQDYHNAVGLAEYMAGNAEETGAYATWLCVRTKNSLACRRHWAAVKALAKELLVHRRLTGRQARLVIRAELERRANW